MMNRRDFFTGLGTLGVVGVAAQALRGSDSESSGGPTASRNRFASAGFGANINPVDSTQTKRLARGGVTLGYIPGSAELVNANAIPGNNFALRNLLGLVNVRAAIGILGYVPSASPTFERVDVTINFAISEPPFYVPFYAWQHVNLPGQYVKSSSPLNFTASVPDAAGITVEFQVKDPLSGRISSGVLYYAIGGSGLGPGIYALAGPSAATGAAPDWSQIAWAEDARSLARVDRMPIDFDYVTLVLSPVSEA